MSDDEHVERKLAAILAADIKGYSRLMGEDEVGTLRRLTAYREVTDALIQHHRGRIVGTAGDSLLAEFASAVDAMQCAVEIQQDLQLKNAELPRESRMEFRIGINVGDVIVEGPQIYGDGVNIAARLEALAEGGGICISGTVYDQVENKLPLGYASLGEQTVKNIAKPVRVYRVVEPGVTASVQGKGAATSSRQPPALPLPDKPSLIVLPFVNMSNDPEQEYFSDGITEDITTDLARISSLFVISRNSAFTYKGKATKAQDISREMGVRYVLEGSVRKAGDRLRITVQLIDALTDYHLWSERYDRSLKDIFTLQDEIVQKIVTTLKLQLSLREQGFLVRKTTDNLEAYDTYLRGLEYFLRFTKEANAQARQMYEKAVVLDSQYAGAYTGLGWTYGMEWLWQWSPDPQNLERAFALARQALALDDTPSGAHALLSWVYRRKHQPEPALAAAEQAVALAPNYDFAYIQLAESLIDLDRPAEAVRAAEQALRLNPRYPSDYLVHLGRAYYLVGRYEEAIAAQQQALLRNPNFLVAYTSLVVNYTEAWLAQQRQDPRTPAQALEAAQRAVALYDSSSIAYLALSLASLMNKQYAQAEAEVEQVLIRNPGSANLYAGAASILNWVGRPAEALKLMEQALQLNPRLPSWHFFFFGQAYDLLGRTEEAVAPLQRVLSMYPHRVEAHVLLAAVYSELGREAEARAEAAEVLRLNPQFLLEVHRQRMPIKDPVVLERHLAALSKVGLK